jgi:hypothetical protein
VVAPHVLLSWQQSGHWLLSEDLSLLGLMPYMCVVPHSAIPERVPALKQWVAMGRMIVALHSAIPRIVPHSAMPKLVPAMKQQVAMGRMIVVLHSAIPRIVPYFPAYPGLAQLQCSASTAAFSKNLLNGEAVWVATIVVIAMIVVLHCATPRIVSYFPAYPQPAHLPCSASTAAFSKNLLNGEAVWVATIVVIAMVA